MAAVCFFTRFFIRLLALSFNFITLWTVPPDVLDQSIYTCTIFHSWPRFASQVYGGTNGETVVFWTWRYVDHGFLCEGDKIKPIIPIYIYSRSEKCCIARRYMKYKQIFFFRYKSYGKNKGTTLYLDKPVSWLDPSSGDLMYKHVNR